MQSVVHTVSIGCRFFELPLCEETMQEVIGYIQLNHWSVQIGLFYLRCLITVRQYVCWSYKNNHELYKRTLQICTSPWLSGNAALYFGVKRELENLQRITPQR